MGKRDPLIIVLVLCILALVGYIIHSEQKRSEQMAILMTELKSAKDLSNKTKVEDPYVENEAKNTILKSYRAAQGCYNKLIARNPKQDEGQLLMDWQVQPNGRVTRATIIRSFTEDAQMKNCMIELISSLEFPPPPENQAKYIHHKFNFKTEATVQRELEERKRLEVKATAQ